MTTFITWWIIAGFAAMIVFVVVFNGHRANPSNLLEGVIFYSFMIVTWPFAVIMIIFRIWMRYQL